jgi:biopolymer transport protein ExbD
MARKRRKKSVAGTRDEDKCELSMTPMIDVVFLLLIFFMCATKFKVPDYRIDANLPKDKGLRAVKVKPIEELPEFRITIDPVDKNNKKDTGATFRIGRDNIVPLNALIQEVRAGYLAIKEDPRYHGKKVPAVIDGNKDVDFMYVVYAIDACLALGDKLDEINFAPPIPDDIRARMGKVMSH